MASLKMHKLALHVGVSGSTASTLKGGSQTSDLSTLCTFNYVRHRSACLSDSFSQYRITTISFLASRVATNPREINTESRHARDNYKGFRTSQEKMCCIFC
jgi:hypothetical protein